MHGTAYAQHMLYVHKLPIDMFYDLEDLEFIVDTQHGITFVELPMDVFYDLDDLKVIVDTQTLDPSDTFTGSSILCPSDFHGSPTITMHKFGIKVPKTFDEAYTTNHQMGNNFWTKAIEKEMANVCLAFGVLEGVTTENMREKKVKAGFKYVGTLIIFYIKTDSKFT